jgi:hypothetical protein
MISFSCPSCKQTLEVEERGAGLIVPCPTCSEQLTIPWKVEPVVVRPAASPSIYDRPKRTEPDVPPVIHAGLLCLCIYVALAFIGLILFHSQFQSQMEAMRQAFNPANLLSLQAAMQNPFSMQMQTLPVVFWLQTIFESAALICAIVAMCTDHVNKGLALLIGSAAAIGLFYFGLNHIADNALREQLAAISQQSIQMQQQMQQQIQQMFGGRPSR